MIPFREPLLIVISCISLWLSGNADKPEPAVEATEPVQERQVVQPRYYIPKEVMFVSDEERECLKLNMFYEAGGEGRRGMLAVGHVTINRSLSNRFPDDLCDVVYQKGQFHWVTQRSVHSVPEAVEPQLEVLSQLIIEQRLVERKPDTLTNGATFFHNRTVKPQWDELKHTASIGQHEFYRY